MDLSMYQWSIEACDSGNLVIVLHSFWYHYAEIYQMKPESIREISQSIALEDT